MITSKKPGRIEAVGHLIFWVGLILLDLGTQHEKMIIERVGESEEIINTKLLLYLTYSISALIFYGNSFFLYPKLFKKGRFVTYVIALVTLSVGLSIAEYLYTSTIIGPINKATLVNHFVFLLFSMLYVLIKSQLHQANAQREIKENQLESELIFLKSQLNPHFLFNTINNIFSMAQKNGDDEVANYLADLSKIMRYSLYESNEVKVSLEKEINFLKSYIQMSMLKFTHDDVDLKLDIEHVFNDQRIAPLLLVPLVENAFKHGPVSGKRVEISIYAKISHNEIEIQVTNSYQKKTQTIDKEIGGIGIKNLKRRLELLYDQQHDFEIMDMGNKYKATLKIRFSGE